MGVGGIIHKGLWWLVVLSRHVSDSRWRVVVYGNEAATEPFDGDYVVVVRLSNLLCGALSEFEPCY